MKRPVQPCGTPAAYQRHRRDGEDPCADCKAAHTARIVHRRRMPKPKKLKTTPMDRLLADDPPQITWRKSRHGIWVADEVIDPHEETPMPRKRAEPAYSAPAPECTNAALLSAARTEI